MKNATRYMLGMLLAGFLTITCSQQTLKGDVMSIWYEGTIEFSCDFKEIQSAFENVGETYFEIVKLMPGLSSVELVEQGSDYVIIKTNEGLMRRTNIRIDFDMEQVLVEYDEEYQAGKMLTTTSHFQEEFKTNSDGIIFKMIISDLKAPGFMGFFYRNFGSSNTGSAFLTAWKTYFEK